MAGSEFEALATQVLDACRAAGVMLATAESCTGGMVAAALTDIAGSSAVVDRGFVTYSNDAKAQLLGVPLGLIQHYGAVSEPVAIAMAAGALDRSNAQIAVSITGVAGPGGGTEHKPVGLVHFAVAQAEPYRVTPFHRTFGDIGRALVRERSVELALENVLSAARLYGHAAN